MTPEESIKDKIARQDHDTLIRVEATVNNMASDLKTLNDGMTLRLTTLEQRVNTIDRFHDALQPQKVADMVEKHDRDIRSLKTTWKTVIFITTTATTALGILITILNQFFGLFK